MFSCLTFHYVFLQSYTECIIVQNSYCYALSIVLGFHQDFPPKLMQNHLSDALCWWSVILILLSPDQQNFDCNRVLYFLCISFPANCSVIHLYLWLHNPIYACLVSTTKSIRNFVLFWYLALLKNYERPLSRKEEANSLS